MVEVLSVHTAYAPRNLFAFPSSQLVCEGYSTCVSEPLLLGKDRNTVPHHEKDHERHGAGDKRYSVGSYSSTTLGIFFSGSKVPHWGETPATQLEMITEVEDLDFGF